MTSLTICLTLMTAADPDAAARAVLALAVAARPAPDAYESLRARAVAEGRPLVVWVGVRRPDLERPDWLHYHCEAFPGAGAAGAVVGRPAAGELWRGAGGAAGGAGGRRRAGGGRAAPPPPPPSHTPARAPRAARRGAALQT